MATQTEILETGSGADNSDEVSVDAGSSVKVSLKAFDNEARAVIEEKDDEGNWHASGHVISAAFPSAVIMAPGTYRVARQRGSCGAFKSE